MYSGFFIDNRCRNYRRSMVYGVDFHFIINVVPRLLIIILFKNLLKNKFWIFKLFL